MKLKVGQKISVRPAVFGDGEGICMPKNPKLPATVIYVSPKGRFYTVEYESGIRESFCCAPMSRIAHKDEHEVKEERSKAAQHWSTGMAGVRLTRKGNFEVSRRDYHEKVIIGYADAREEAVKMKVKSDDKYYREKIMGEYQHGISEGKCQYISKTNGKFSVSFRLFGRRYVLSDFTDFRSALNGLYKAWREVLDKRRAEYGV